MRADLSPLIDALGAVIVELCGEEEPVLRYFLEGHRLQIIYQANSMKVVYLVNKNPNKVDEQELRNSFSNAQDKKEIYLIINA